MSGSSDDGKRHSEVVFDHVDMVVPLDSDAPEPDVPRFSRGSIQVERLGSIRSGQVPGSTDIKFRGTSLLSVGASGGEPEDKGDSEGEWPVEELQYDSGRALDDGNV